MGPRVRGDDAKTKGWVMAIKTSEIKCGDVPAYYAQPERAASAGGVLLLPSIHGREPYVMDYVHALAQAGYPTLLWDIFPGMGEAHTREERARRGKMLSDGGSLQQMSRCLDSMLGELGLKGVVALGFCLGGRYTLVLAAHDQRLRGIVSYYPTIETPRLPSQEWDAVAEAVNIACPVHLITPGNDHLTSHETFQMLQKNLQSRSQPTSIQYFPQAEHAYLQVERRPGAANAQAVTMSRAAAFGFLAATLGSPDTHAAKADGREQCWLMNATLADPQPKLSLSMEEITNRHHAYIHDLEAKGRLVGAGAFRDETGARHGTGLIIIRAASRAEAEALARQEPYIANGVRVLTLVPWQRSAGR
jgi:carboxymethylenebutenolidase